ncbi:aminoglycoside phosphotransferase family protein [Pseudonocardia sp. TRM90224]|uniref:aminoglycoside phosphotransferase family protein n=1 Tax=Pseudonocardia sp. TRM90224 TaxID=2812678 RepID=UPI001E57A1F0|nr:aminoglycoside phosphotransferase family protein [Pseudonocardia sp. TRM90224]
MNTGHRSVSVTTVRELLDRQFPRWADRPITAGPSGGAGNALFRLGDDLVVRLPLHPGSSAAVDVELPWLPRLAPQLPLAVPVPVAAGAPEDVFPRRWAVFRWLRGTDLATDHEVDLADAAVRLGRFVGALRSIDAMGAPPSLRPHPLHGDDTEVRSDIHALGADGVVDDAAATAVWEAARAAPSSRFPEWIHGDLFPMNLLAERGMLSAVIDFDLMGAGDSAVDLVPAWTLLTAETRPLFREASGVDDDAWVRGRGWALRAALGAIRKYGRSSDPRAAIGRYALSQTLAD